MTTNHTGKYVQIARIVPAVLTAAPALLLLSFAPDLISIAKFVPVLAFFGMTILAAEVSHTAGRRLQRRLIIEWGGLPTLSALRHRSSLPKDDVKLNRRAVETVSRLTLPTAQQERTHPERADEAYRRAVKTCMDLVRANQPGSEILFSTNVSYGFRRNTRALKPYALFITAATLAAALLIASVTGRWDLGVAVTGTTLVVALVWLVIVRRSWVREAADFFAEQFFRSLDSSTFARSV